MNLIDAKLADCHDEIAPGIGLLFDENVDDTFKKGIGYIKKAMVDNVDIFVGKIEKPKVFLVSNVAADRVDYQPIALLGATIKWLNEFFELEIAMPKYTYDRENRVFSVE